MAKLKLAIYWAAACGGCDVAVLDVHEKILDIADAADILLWPVATDHKYADVEKMAPGSIDVCLFNGAVRNSENEHIAKMLREKSKVMVAFGSCAVSGGIPALANFKRREDILQRVYMDTPSTVNPEQVLPVTDCPVPEGVLHLPEFFGFVHSLNQVVEVDYYVPGCPPTAERIWEVVQAIATGNLPAAGATVGALDKSLCDECPREKSNKKIKRFYRSHEIIPDPQQCLLEQGLLCMGPVTRGGCGGQCISANMPCRGCYGPLPGVLDQGAKYISSIGAIIDARTPEEVKKILAGIADPAGTFYRFGMSTALLKGANR
ncbi:oxidoreductase [Desulfoscipio gibsoniae]|uniref:Coenzyme F420-reducing hydrogenase, gamma subunit n=1 Tax=Desulfoscipio gibsoniae DSM 7213 TaxID=767817 RepID=R4KBW2_9FIRM|nr:oxidoreductase [Desulfoscipio gibsoniae]AGL00688.1 coenzyme F420-reducing hydrogenase, gamma subunit [Desulfoscipio gibsoniae DSM 7213]